MTEQRYRILTLLTCIGMFLVLIAGVLVTNTDSGRGCGTDWPLCNGKFVPAYTVESMVEYTHRMVSGIVGLLVGATFLATWLWKPANNKESMYYAGGALLFTVAQAILGAMAVLWEQSSIVMALHFGISLFAFTCTWLLYKVVKRRTMPALAPAAGARGTAAASRSAATARTDAARLARPLPAGLFSSIVAVLVYCYFVVYLGAYIRHTSAAGGCDGWPLCNGEVVPELSGVTGIAFAHRIAALVMLIVVAVLYFYVRKVAGQSTELTRIASGSLLLVGMQVLSGGLLALTLSNEDVYIFTGLLHTVIIAALFSMLCLLAIRTKQMLRTERSEDDR